MKIKNLLIFIFILLTGCKDEFTVEVKNTKQVMVVDGMVTNEPGPYTVKISLSSVINEFRRIPYEGCLVILYENDNMQEELTEVEPGVYQTAEDGIQGTIGNRYSISILTPDGNEYESDYQEMRAPVGIDSVYAELIYKQQEEIPYTLPGYQFYVDTKTAATQKSYFVWNMEETFEYTTEYYPFAYFDGYNTLINHADIMIDDNYRCWNTQSVSSIYTATTSNLTVPKVNKQPLHFIGTDTKKLQERYSLLLKQYSVSKEAYVFWKKIEEQYAEDNFLVASQPYNISGNVKHIENPDELVYGYFTVASKQEKRVFFDRPDARFYYEQCLVYHNLQYFRREHIPIYIIQVEGGLAGVNKICIDCTLEGGHTEKPDFWIE